MRGSGRSNRFGGFCGGAGAGGGIVGGGIVGGAGRSITARMNFPVGEPGRTRPPPPPRMPPIAAVNIRPTIFPTIAVVTGSAIGQRLRFLRMLAMYRFAAALPFTSRAFFARTPRRATFLERFGAARFAVVRFLRRFAALRWPPTRPAR
jgi:hypothetical protein